MGVEGSYITIQVVLNPKPMFFNLIPFLSNININYMTKRLNLSAHGLFPNCILEQNFTDLHTEVEEVRKEREEAKKTREKKG